MDKTPRGTVLAVVSVVSLTVGCAANRDGQIDPDDDVSSMEEFATVLFEYTASTTVSPDINYGSCTESGLVWKTHLQIMWGDSGGWNNRRNMAMVPPTLYELSVPIPIDRTITLALHDPNNCLRGNVYVAPLALHANGVRLTEVVDVVIGDGVMFRVDADGVVTQ